MSHDERRNAPSSAAVVTVDVAPADTTGIDLDQNIVRTDLWLRYITQLQITRFLKDKCLHISKYNL